MLQEQNLSDSDSYPQKKRGRSTNDRQMTSQEKLESQKQYQLFQLFYESCQNISIDFLYLKEYFNVGLNDCPHDVEILKIQKKLNNRRFSSNPKKSWSFDEKKVLVWVIGKYCSLKQKNCRFLNSDDFNEIAQYLFRRNAENIKQKWTSMHKTSLIAQPFTQEEDQQLQILFEKYKNDENRWKKIAQEMSKVNQIYRTSKQLRERWINYLDPSLIKIKDPWTDREDLELIYQIQQKGKKWTEIAKQLKRNENQVKNRFNGLLKRDEVDDDLNKLIDKILWRISKYPIDELKNQHEKQHFHNNHLQSLLLAVGNIESITREESYELTPCMVNLKTNQIYFTPNYMLQEILLYQQQDMGDGFEKIKREIEKFEPSQFRVASLSIISEEYQQQPQLQHNHQHFIHSFSEMPNFESSNQPASIEIKTYINPFYSLKNLQQKYIRYRTDLSLPKVMNSIPWKSQPQLLFC
ncbi:unnamed protein product [Paramecium pentaurelia]|uniref:Uncharacterized protein n=1 Tax=Paramecium pentaurelia TaxID=43138 RepID=A0A8S1UZD3_9CILI|nr:unnamed protein product [Paramecium pentaurelia]